MSKWKLQVLLIPLDFTYIPTFQIDPSVIKRFLHLAEPTAELTIIKEEIEIKYKKLYPHEEPLDIERLQDGNNNDLDPDFFVNDVFASGDILRIIVNNRFKQREVSMTPFHRIQHHTPILTTPLPINTGSDFTIGTVGTNRKRTQNYLETGSLQIPKRNNLGSLQSQGSSPVALAPPPSAENRTIPTKRISSSPVPSKDRITSGMLVMPPHACQKEVLSQHIPLHLVNSDSSDYSENDIPMATTSRPKETIQPDRYVSNSDEEIVGPRHSSLKKPVSAKKSDEPSLPREEIINVFKKGLKIPERKLKPIQKAIPQEFQNRSSQEIIRSLHINMVDADPDLTLDRGSRVGARNAARIAASKIALSEGSSSRNKVQKQLPNPSVVKPKAKPTPVKQDQKLHKGKQIVPKQEPKPQTVIPDPKPKETSKSKNSPEQASRRLVAIAPKPELDEDSSLEEDEISDGKPLGRLQQFQERLKNFETDLNKLSINNGTALKKMPTTFTSRVDEEIENIKGLILDPRLILVDRESRPYKYAQEIDDACRSPSESLNEPRDKKSRNNDVIKIGEEENNGEKSNQHKDSQPAVTASITVKPTNSLLAQSNSPELIDLIDELPEETPKSIALTSIKGIISVNSSTPPPIQSTEIVPPPAVNLASNESSIPSFFRTPQDTKHSSVPPINTQHHKIDEPVKASSIGPTSDLQDPGIKKSFVLTLSSKKLSNSDTTTESIATGSTATGSTATGSAATGSTISVPDPELEPASKPTSQPTPTRITTEAEKSLNVSLKITTERLSTKVFSATVTNKSPSFQGVNNGSELTNGHIIQRDGTITHTNGNKRPLDDSSSGESSDEEDDASSDSDPEEEENKIKKPRLVASIPSTIRRSQSPMVRTPTPPPKVNNEIEITKPNEPAPVPVTIAAPATIAAPEKTYIVSILKPTPQPVSTPSLKKPLLPSLSDLVNRGLPEVKDVNQTKGELPVKNTEPEKENESSSSDESDSESDNSDSESDYDNSGKFITMKSAKETQPKKKSNLFMSLLRK